MHNLLRPFQRRFVRAALRPEVDTAVLSLPRGNGKSWLAAHLLARGLTPGDSVHQPGAEYLLCAASIEQARIVFRFVREIVEPTGEYRFLDSHNRIGIAHVATRTRLRVLSSNGKTAMGIVGCPLLVADEPGSWEVGGGQLMHDAIQTAQGKPGSRLRAVYIGTLAPSRGGWWHELVDDGCRGSTYVQAIRGDRERWDLWPTIRKANPLTMISATFRRKLLEERDAARRDTRLKARFLSFRLNVPTADESTTLLTVDEWQRVCDREVPERAGRPIVGVDLGAGRAWSAAVAVFRSGRVEAVALAPGIPGLEAQERRDRVPAGLYRKLAAGGQLRIAEGLRVQPPAQLIGAVRDLWGPPEVIFADRFQVSALRDVQSRGTPLVERVTRWSAATEDISALRRQALDGPLSCAPSSRALIAASLAVAEVKNDDQGSCRLVKNKSSNSARDDVAAALVLAAGALERAPDVRPAVRYHVC